MFERLVYIKSSSGSFYNIRFEFDGSNGCFSCDCKAGIFGDFCKHLKTFFDSDSSLLFDQQQAETFTEICTFVKNSFLYDEYVKMVAELQKIDAERKRLNAETAAVKREFYNKIRVPATGA